MTQEPIETLAAPAQTQTIKTMRNRWMGYLLDNNTANIAYSLINITIPGTHDTGTWKLSGGDIGNMSAKCQDMSLKDQLEHGIRFIDIRLVPERNDDKNMDDLMVYHGDGPTKRCDVWFSDIINTCNDFLADNATETIIMSVKNEHNVADATFVAAVDAFMDTETQKNNASEKLFSTGNSVPLLKDSKGHIVLFRRYNGSTKGIDGVTGWPNDNKTSTPTTGAVPMMIQDVYKMAAADQGDKKWREHIHPFLTDARTTQPSVLWFNFTSTSGGGYPHTFSDEINPLLQAWLELEVQAQQNSLGTNRLGAIMMDFPTPRLIDNLIAMNIGGSPSEVIQGVGYKFRLSNNKAYIGKAYYYSGDEWNYAQCYFDNNFQDVILHSLVKVGGSDSYEIEYGDTVRIMSSQFSNDTYVYLESFGCKGKGINLFYDDKNGSYQKNSQAVEWIIEWSPNNNTPGKNGAVEKGDLIRFRSVMNTDHYLLAATDQYLAVAPVSKDPDGGVEGGYDWVIE